MGLIEKVSHGGSSPRMWGTRTYSNSCRWYRWFIPTHVGNSQIQSQKLEITLVHPHACGELTSTHSPSIFSNGSSPRMWGTRNLQCFLDSQNGSSPRMWGTPSHSTRSPFFKRFIPTHVGNSPAHIYTKEDILVHPHACGELLYPLPTLWGGFGSSPRMWGTRIPLCVCPLQSRFIPTHVGNSLLNINP